MAKRISGSVGKGGKVKPADASTSKITQKVMKQLSYNPDEEEELLLAIASYSKIAQKGNEQKIDKAKQELGKALKKLKKVKLQDVEKALKKVGVE